MTKIEIKSIQKGVYGLLVACFGIFLLMGCDNPPPAEETEASTPKKSAAIGFTAHSIAMDSDVEELSLPPSSHEPGLIPIQQLPYEELELPVMGSQTLYGRLYDPFQKPESDDEDEESEEEEANPTEKYPLVILLHTLNGRYRDWEQLPARLVKAGYAVLVVDQRGHGKSALRGQTWRSFQDEQWKRLPDDVLRMITFFDGSEDYPQVDSNRVGLVGASLGANVALIAGARDNATEDRIKAMIVLSTGMEYKGLNATKPIYRYKSPLMMIASQNDKYAFESTQMLNRLHTGIKSVKLYKNIGHGTDMIRFFPELQKEIVQWLVITFPPTPAPITYPDDEDEESDESNEDEE